MRIHARETHEMNAAMDATATGGRPPSPEAVEALKASWQRDPCWTLAETEGFGDYAEELASFEAEKREQWLREQDEREQAQDAQRRQRESEFIRRRMDELDLAYGAPNEQAHNIAVATVVIERALNRLTVHVERLADMFEHVIDRERATVRVDSPNHY